MWPFTSSSENAKTKLARFRQLQKLLVPPMGECETWQGEVIRIIGNAEDEANRNGFINWDDEDDRDMDLFVEHLCGDRTFDEKNKKVIRELAESIKFSGHDPDGSSPSDQDWHFLFCCAADWCDAHKEPIPLKEGGDYVGHF